VNLSLKVIFAITALLALCGCVAVWGEAHKVMEANSEGIRIQYDKAMTSSVRTTAIAREHCKKYGKVAEPLDSRMPGMLFGIIEESFSCITSNETKPASTS
jgi:hypothetical protein